MAQYVARNVDNTPRDPQPGDQEVVDKFNNVFDNFNKKPGSYQFDQSDINSGLLDQWNLVYGDAANGVAPSVPTQTAKTGQEYQNLEYDRYIPVYGAASNGAPSAPTNTKDPSQPQPDANQWVAYTLTYGADSNGVAPGVPTQSTRTPQPYVPSPLWPNGEPSNVGAEDHEGIVLQLQITSSSGPTILVDETDVYSLELVGVEDLHDDHE